MKRLFIIVAVLLVVVSAFADRRKMLLQAATRLPSTTFLITENFDATGFDITAPNAWATVNNVNPDDTLAVANGTQDCAVYRVAATSTATLYWTDIGPGTNLSHVAAFFSLKCSATNLTGTVCSFNTNGSILNILQVRNTGRLRMYDSASTLFASPSDGIPLDTLFYIWVEIDNTAGTGNVEWSTTPVKVGSGTKYASFTGGPSGFLVNQIQLASSTALQTNSFDYLRVWTNALPSTPQ